MTITGARWGHDVNRLTIRCDCGAKFDHRADRWKVRCPLCKREQHLGELRQQYAQQ